MWNCRWSNWVCNYNVIYSIPRGGGYIKIINIKLCTESANFHFTFFLMNVVKFRGCLYWWTERWRRKKDKLINAGYFLWLMSQSKWIETGAWFRALQSVYLSNHNIVHYFYVAPLDTQWEITLYEKCMSALGHGEEN